MSRFTRYLYLKETSSTNQYCQDFINKLATDEAVCVYTYHQTQGRGQIGRHWHCGKGLDLAYSLKLSPPNLLIKDQFKLNINFALAVRDVISGYFPEVKIKWPNDIYVGQKKIAGILIQNVLSGAFVSSTILGVGINVNSQVFPADLPNPISLFELRKQESNQLSIVHQLTKRIYERLEMPSQENNKTYLEQLYLLNQAAQFMTEDQEITGIIKGVSESGKLKIEVNEVEKQFNFREIKYLI